MVWRCVNAYDWSGVLCRAPCENRFNFCRFPPRPWLKSGHIPFLQLLIKPLFFFFFTHHRLIFPRSFFKSHKIEMHRKIYRFTAYLSNGMKVSQCYTRLTMHTKKKKSDSTVSTDSINPTRAVPSACLAPPSSANSTHWAVRLRLIYSQRGLQLAMINTPVGASVLRETGCVKIKRRHKIVVLSESENCRRFKFRSCFNVISMRALLHFTSE